MNTTFHQKERAFINTHPSKQHCLLNQKEYAFLCGMFIFNFTNQLIDNQYLHNQYVKYEYFQCCPVTHTFRYLYNIDHSSNILSQLSLTFTTLIMSIYIFMYSQLNTKQTTTLVFLKQSVPISSTMYSWKPRQLLQCPLFPLLLMGLN